jgi:sporulation protein YlmC with PRC-barrel domain
MGYAAPTKSNGAAAEYREADKSDNITAGSRMADNCAAKEPFAARTHWPSSSISALMEASMKAIFAVVGCAGLSALLALPAYAQTTTNPPPVRTTNTMVASTDRNAPDGSLEQYHGMWRASKLVGTNVYNQEGQSIGSVDDLLLDKDGKVNQAVLSVGGFLGIGGKLVAVPFDQFKFEESRRSMTAANAPANGVAPAGTVANPAPAPAPAAGMTTTTNPPMNRTDIDNGQPVYYSLVLPNATKQSLSSAAGFKYNG